MSQAHLNLVSGENAFKLVRPGGVVRGDEAKGERRTDTRPCRRVASTEDRCCRVAGGVEARDYRSVILEHARVLVGDNTARGADIAGINRDSVERPLLDLAKAGV